MDRTPQIVRRFAQALDEDDYRVAEKCMEADAFYDDAGTKTIFGREAILQSFKAASDWGRANLDYLRFSHEIDDALPLRIRFFDTLGYAGEEITVDHTMHVEFSERGLIASLRLVYPPGERDRVRAFFERHALNRPSTGSG